VILIKQPNQGEFKMITKEIYESLKKGNAEFEIEGIKFTNFNIKNGTMTFSADTAEGAHLDAYCTPEKNKFNPNTIKFNDKEEINNIFKAAIEIADSYNVQRKFNKYIALNKGE
jgi:hypothetical protein